MPFAAPSYADEYPEFICYDIEFGHPVLQIEFNPAALDVRLHGDSVALEQAKSICESEIQRWDNDRTVVEQVREILSANCALTLLQVSEQLHITGRTLHRKLQKEHGSFHQIQNEVRHLLAKQHLAQGLLRVKEIAFALGYSDVANFRRAFKRWEGCSPMTYRERATKQGN